MRDLPLTLCYHAVSATWTDQLAVAPDVFEDQIRLLLRRGLKPAAAEQVLAGEPRTFHVTFDDAYRNIRGALATLRELGVPATVFACSGLADTGAPLAVPELAGRAPGDELDTMTWDELRDLSGNGVEIGSHTVTHPHLPTLDDETLLDELARSREEIESQLGVPCRLLAYPYGEQDRRVRAVAREAGYLAAFGLDEPLEPPAPFALPRADIYRKDGPARFRLKTSGVRGTIRKAAGAARRVRR
jgi:peptidoglycan/xylan/chitin deacetylase (PgdA/CDA1 family)